MIGRKLTGAKPDGILDKAALDFCMEGGHALVVKGDFAADEDVEDDAKAPDIDFGADVELCVEEFGGGKVEGAAESGETGGGVVEVGEAKVDYFDITGLGNEDVFDFEVCGVREWRVEETKGTDRGGRRCCGGSTRGRFRSGGQTCGRRVRGDGRVR